MKRIMTVCGPICADKIGLTSMHDHIMADLNFFCNPLTEKIVEDSPIELTGPIKMADLSYLRTGLGPYSPDNWDLTDVDIMRSEVEYFRERGGVTILEPSAPGIRGDIKNLKKIAETTGVNIIASTGLYREETWPERFRQMKLKELQAHFLNEINCGIDGTDIKAGHIKTAIAAGSENEFRMLKAIVTVAKASNLLVTVHISYGTTPEHRRRMLKTLLDAGMPPEKLLLCHIHNTFAAYDVPTYMRQPELWRPDLSWAKEALDQGVNVCVDLFGSPMDNETLESYCCADTLKLSGLVELIGQGYAGQIVIGNDVYQKIMTRSYGGHGYCRIINYVIPGLLLGGIDRKTIEQITVHNPARLLQY